MLSRETRYRTTRLLVEQFIITLIALGGTGVLVRIGTQILICPVTILDPSNVEICQQVAKGIVEALFSLIKYYPYQMTGGTIVSWVITNSIYGVARARLISIGVNRQN
jgi:hypothetical protein